MVNLELGLEAELEPVQREGKRPWRDPREIPWFIDIGWGAGDRGEGGEWESGWRRWRERTRISAE